MSRLREIPVHLIDDGPNVREADAGLIASTGGPGTIDVGVDLDERRVDFVVSAGARGGALLSLTAEEARLVGRRLQQAADGITVGTRQVSA